MKRKYTFSQQIVSQLELILFSVGREMAHKKPWMHRHVSLRTTSTWVASTTRIRSEMSTVFLSNHGTGTVTWRSFSLKRPWWTHTFYGSFHQIMEPSHSSIFAWNWSLNYSAIIHVAKGNKLQTSSTEIEVRDGKSHFPVHVTLNRCSYCASRGQRHRSSWGCALCAVALCAGCFEPYHTTWRTLAWIKMEGAKFKFSWLSQKLVYLTCSSNYCCKCFASSLLWNNLLKQDILTVKNVISSKMHICNQEREPV